MQTAILKNDVLNPEPWNLNHAPAFIAGEEVDIIPASNLPGYKEKGLYWIYLENDDPKQTAYGYLLTEGKDFDLFGYPIKEFYQYNIPNWAMYALFSGDLSELSSDDRELLTEFLEKESYIDDWEWYDNNPEQEPSFCKYPEFGLACDCYKIIGTIAQK